MRFEPATRAAGAVSASVYCFAFAQGQLLLPSDGAAEELPAPLIALPLFTALHQPDARPHYLGRLEGHDCWALRLEQAPEGWRSLGLRAAMMQWPEALAGVAGRAAQVLEWDRAHRYCGACGTPTLLHESDRARICPACKHTAYPRLSPAMMVLVWRPGELLLARAPHYAKGVYSALAGFVEAGESLEECVAREVEEEVGLRVADLRYYGSQSWPFPHSLMVAYTARWAGGEIVRQDQELEDAQWFALDALPVVPPRFSISGHLIRDTLAAMQSSGRPA